MNDLFARHGFKTEFFGDTPVGDASMRQRVLRPIKKLAVMLGIMPKTTGGKKWLKRIVFGGLVEMPVEIDPHPSGIRSPVTSEFHGAGITPQRNSPDKSGIPQGKQSEKDDKTLYRGRYVEPDRISSEEANTSHKVIYCVAILD
ncbi:hypothetical protein KAW18_09150 [candidate division WOR-3 bacterium]|nr:hypothetical protein [candidate division WOR-3 bacterium]